MNTQELRLGNYVYAIDYNNYDSGMVISRVSVIGETTLMLENLDLIHNIKDIEPIELTSDILQKCGFNKSKMDGYDCHFIYTKYNGSQKFKITALYDANFSVCALEDANCIKYLHQLQNLYFAICGKELEVKFKNK